MTFHDLTVQVSLVAFDIASTCSTLVVGVKIILKLWGGGKRRS